MKKILFVVALVLIYINISAQTDFREIENNAFREGERLVFNVKYGFVTAGIAEMAIPKIKKISGREAYHVTFRVNSVSTFDPFFEVRDRYETYIDTKGIFPWRFEQHIREGKFSKDYSAFFDQRRNSAKTTDGSYDIPEYVHDIVSAFYYIRTIDFSGMEPGDKVVLENFYNGKVNPLDVVYHGTEKVTVDAGEFECIIVEPMVVEGGLFKSEGNILIWLSNDELKIPVKVSSKIIIGSISAELSEFEGLAGELLSKK